MGETSAALVKRAIGRYRLYDPIASGGMAVVHLGRFVAAGGFSRTVAIKRLHPHAANDPRFVAKLLEEARLAARIVHPNVAAIIDVVQDDAEVCLILEYVEGESLSRLMGKAHERGLQMPAEIARSIMLGVLYGLHAAHTATGDDGARLDLVHRDVSPQNILVGVDGMARLIDFGVAKATARMQTTQEGELKGKLGYMAPEQLAGKPVDARTDVFAAGAVLWEALVGDRLFESAELAEVLRRAVDVKVEAPSARARGVTPALDDVVLRALALSPDDRFPSAAAMASALAATGPAASPQEVGEWVVGVGGADLAKRIARVAEIASRPNDGAGGDESAPTHELPTAHEAPTSAPLSLSTPEAAAPKGVGRPVPRASVAAVVGGLVLAGASGLWLARTHPAGGGSAAMPTGILGSVEPPPPAASSASVAQAPPPPSSRSPVAPTTPAPTTSARPRRGRPPPLAASSAPRARPSYCLQGKQGFTIGEDGIERVRPECEL